MTWLPKRSRTPRGADVVGAAEALLCGRPPGWFSRHHRQPPEQDLINALAHADLHRMRQFRRDGLFCLPGTWPEALGRLAAEMLERAPAPAALVELQRQVLVPIELGVLGGEILLPCDPTVLTRSLIGALAGHPSRWLSDG